MEDTTVRDEGGLKRKMMLFECVSLVQHKPLLALTLPRALEGIKGKLESILERTSAVEYQENDADKHAISQLAEDVRDAVIEYQVRSN